MSTKDIREISGFLALVATVVIGWSIFGPSPSNPMTRVLVRIPEDQAFHPTGGRFDVSRDGVLMVYRRRSDEGGSELWVRRWSASDATPIPGTDGASLPAISPDGREVAFTVEGDPALIRVVAVSGGGSRTIADSASIGGVRWSPDGAWVYYTNASLGLSRVAAAGGPSEILTRVDSAMGGAIHWAVEVLPGGRALVFTESDFPVLDPRIKVLNMETGTVGDLWAGSFPRYSETGHLLFREAEDAVLLAAPFDVENLELTGTPQPVVRRLLHVDGWPLFSLSQTGTLVYATPVGGAHVAPVWVQRDGTAQAIDPRWSHRGYPTYSGLALSPNGTRLAISLLGPEGTWDLWVKELDTGTLSKLTSEGTLNYRPTWLPDGQSLTFISDRAGQVDLWSKPVDGPDVAKRILDRQGVIRNGFYSPDGDWLIFREGEAPVADIFALRAAQGTEAIPVVVTESGERSPAISPNGRWLAYTSNESGAWHVWVTAFPLADSGRWQVSTNGGQEPVWAHSGRELFYRNLANELVAVQVGEDPTFEVGAQEVLFSMEDYLDSDGRAQYDVSPDDERFVMLRFEGGGGMELFLLQNLFEELKERVGN